MHFLSSFSFSLGSYCTSAIVGTIFLAEMTISQIELFATELAVPHTVIFRESNDPVSALCTSASVSLPGHLVFAVIRAIFNSAVPISTGKTLSASGAGKHIIFADISLPPCMFPISADVVCSHTFYTAIIPVFSAVFKRLAALLAIVHFLHRDRGGNPLRDDRCARSGCHVLPIGHSRTAGSNGAGCQVIHCLSFLRRNRNHLLSAHRPGVWYPMHIQSSNRHC